MGIISCQQDVVDSFSYICTTGSCKMIISIITSCLLYSVNYLVYTVLKSQRVGQNWRRHACMLVWDLRFTITTFALGLYLWSQVIIDHKSRLPSIIYYLHTGACHKVKHHCRKTPPPCFMHATANFMCASLCMLNEWCPTYKCLLAKLL